MSRTPIVVDTNVLIAANDASRQIASKCAARLQKARDQAVVCVDSEWRILREYGRHLPAKGRQNPGDMFYLWLAQNLSNPKYCAQVPIRSTDASGTSFEEFPALDEGTGKRIDPSDRKFIAVANAHPGKPPILQATDSKWIGWKDGLAAAGIRVEFIDEESLRPVYEKKMKGTG